MATTVGIVTKGKMIYQDSIESLRMYAQQKVLLKVSDSEQAWRSLLGNGIKADWEDGIILFSEHSDEKVAKAIHTLVHEGYSIYRVEEEKRSLEDTFLQMTTREKVI